MRIKNNFHINGFELRLALKQMLETAGCERYNSKTRLGGKICGSDVNTHNGHEPSNTAVFLLAARGVSWEQRETAVLVNSSAQIWCTPGASVGPVAISLIHGPTGWPNTMA